MPTVLFTALGQQVDHAPAGREDPAHALAVVDESEHFHPVGQPRPPGPADEVGHGVDLAVGYPGGGYLDTVHPHLFQQCLADVGLFLRGEGYPMGLLAVPQGGVEDLDTGGRRIHG